MDGTFELNKPGNYTVELFDENHFLNDKNSPQDLAKFGKTYSVKMVGDAETYLWTTKTEPVEGKSYYGHIQETSGKMLRFKVDKLADGNYSTGPEQAPQSTPEYEPSTNTRWAIALAYRAFVQVTGSVEDSGGEFPFKAVELHASSLLKMFDKLKSGSLSASSRATNESDAVPTPSSTAAPSAGLLGNAYRNRDKAVSYDEPPEDYQGNIGE